MAVTTIPHVDEDRRFTAHLGMYITLAAMAMFFFTLFMIYAAIRTRLGGYLGVETRGIPFILATVNTLVLAVSSGAYQYGLRSIRRGHPDLLRRWTTVTMVLGLGFLVSQGTMWAIFIGRNVLPSTEVFGAIFFTLTGLHALHVVAALIVLGWIWIPALKGRWTARDHVPVEIGGLFWHFLGLVWLVMYVVIFIV